MDFRRRRRLICCEVFHREVCHLVSRAAMPVDVTFLPKGLHDLETEDMLRRLQAVVDDVESGLYDAILLGYALCNNGLAGLQAREIPLVLPRAHDCITLFLGSRERYRTVFDEHPGTYFLTSGWIERGETRGELEEYSIQQRTGMNLSREELVAQYGEDNADYILETLRGQAHYDRFTFIEMGIEPDERFEKEAARRARERNWELMKRPGDMSLLERLINGPWSEEDFLLVPEGRRIRPSYDETVVRLVEE